MLSKLRFYIQNSFKVSSNKYGLTVEYMFKNFSLYYNSKYFILLTKSNSP